MKFQEGDKIVVNSTGERGRVVAWISKKMLEIEVEGVCFPVYADQVDFPYYADFTKPKEISVKKAPSLQDFPVERKSARTPEPDGIKLSFLPVLDTSVFDEDLIARFKLYLINQSEDTICGSFELMFSGHVFIEVPIELKSFLSMYAVDIPFERINDHPQFHLKLKKGDAKHSDGSWHHLDYRPKAKQLFKLAMDTVEKKHASFDVKLTERLPEIPNQPASAETSNDLGIAASSDQLGVLHQTGFRIKQSQKKKEA